MPQRRSVDTTATQSDHTQVMQSSTKSDTDVLRENEEIFQFCPPERNLRKIFDGLLQSIPSRSISEPLVEKHQTATRLHGHEAL